MTNVRGVNISDGIKYHYKGTRIHRIEKDVLFQGGDLLDERGNCSKSIYNDGGLFCDESFIFRHVGAGCISYCNRGPDSNGSLFQVVFRPNAELDDRHVVFGCLASDASYDVLGVVNAFGSASGEPLEDIRITDCGLAYPLPRAPKALAPPKAQAPRTASAGDETQRENPTTVEKKTK